MILAGRNLYEFSVQITSRDVSIANLRLMNEVNNLPQGVIYSRVKEECVIISSASIVSHDG